MDPEAVRAKVSEGEKHLETSVKLYEQQAAANRYFLHEHPRTAKSWETRAMTRARQIPGAIEVTAPMCSFGMWMEDAQGWGLVKGDTRYLTNSPRIAERLSRRCANRDPELYKLHHRHVQLLNGRPLLKQVYPPELVAAILGGLVEQMHDDGLMSLDQADVGPVNEEPDMVVNTQDQEDEYKKYIDDVHGGLLDPAGVEAARREEIEWMAANGPTYVPESPG